LAEPMKKELHEFRKTYTEAQKITSTENSSSTIPSFHRLKNATGVKKNFTTKYYSYKWVYAEILMICE
jgi:predicted RNA-binding protein with EMAP domain